MPAETTELTREQVATAVEAMRVRMLDGKATFADLWNAGNDALGLPYSQDTPCYRLADRWLQKQRRAGNVSFVRDGHRTVWSATSQGLERLGPPQDSPRPPGP